MFEELYNKILGLLKVELKNSDIELIELNIKRRGKTIAIEILMDKEQGGITIDECSGINRHVSNTIEEKEWVDGDYVVEVSSPGLDRPLTTPRDFQRVLGRMVRVHLAELISGKREHLGIVKEVLEDQIIIEAKKTLVTIPLEKVNKAVQIIE